MKSLRLNVTKRCNLSCSYCYIKNKEENMDKTLFENLIKKYSPESISISGGEPFMHAEIEELIKTALENVKTVNIVTNGIMLKEKYEFFKGLASDFNLNNLSISISLDGVYKCETELMYRLNALGIRIRTYIYPLLKNYDELINLVPSFADSCQLLFPVPMGRNDTKVISKEKWQELVLEFKNAAANADIKLYSQQGYSSLFNHKDINHYGDKPGIFADCSGETFKCCLLAEAAALGYEIHDEGYSCEKNGCLALRVLHGTDYRLREDEKPPCPFDLVLL